ncbi:hypothetical protein J4Q44_G00260950 [Coregonus suidteri]|uniref:Uncharacterized protein n=1 Tax=Coregonus suidteri TaxID=861788 RepID=A0AAN8LHA4_9TELE
MLCNHKDEARMGPDAISTYTVDTDQEEDSKDLTTKPLQPLIRRVAEFLLSTWRSEGGCKGSQQSGGGTIISRAQFGCLAWSACESRVLYVSEGKRTIAESSAKASSPSARDPTAGPSGDLSGKIKAPVLLMLGGKDWRDPSPRSGAVPGSEEQGIPLQVTTTC